MKVNYQAKCQHTPIIPNTIQIFGMFSQLKHTDSQRGMKHTVYVICLRGKQTTFKVVHLRSKEKVKLSLCLIKHNAMKMYGGLDVPFKVINYEM
jgi:hypothetical protein